MKVSIALCTFNGERFIKTQLDSIAAQTHPPDELLISDDGSTDSTISIAEDFARSASFRVRIDANKTNSGAVRNFEKAVGSCRGDVIFLCDQDDFWLPGKIARTLKEFTASDVSMVFSDAEIADSGLRPTSKRLSSVTFTARARRQRPPDMFEVLLERNVVTGMTMAFRANLREIFLPIPTDLPGIVHDGWISITASLYGRCVFIDEPHVLYRQHGEQLIGATDGRPMEETQEFARRDRIARSVANANYQMDRLSLLRARLESQIFPLLGQQKVESARGAMDREFQFLEDGKKHMEWRLGLSPSRAKRFPGILAQLINGNYSRFSNGSRSAVKDLFDD